MASITFPRKQFEKEIGKLDEKMENRIAMFGTPLEKFTDEEIEIEVFPNRPDLLSYQGFKRSFLAFLGKHKGLKKYQINKPEKDYIVKIDSSVKNVWPYACCAIVKGLKFDDDKIKEIIDIQEKLTFTLGRKRSKLGLGIYPLDKIKLPIQYKALEPDKIKFVPLESDREMSGLQILQRHPTGREYAHLLAGKQKFPIFIDAEEKILSMPPIINSHLTGKVTVETKDVFVECTGKDLNILKKALNIFITTLADMGGKIYQMELQEGKTKIMSPDLSPEKMALNISNANNLLGIELSEKQIKGLIEKMGCNYNKGIVETPSWRVDMLHEVDLIEEIAIAYGYENFKPVIPEVVTLGKESKKGITKRKIAEILTGLKLLETSSYHLTTKKDQFNKMGTPLEKFTEVESSKTEYNILRKNLSHYLMKILSENVDTEYPQKIFEIGKVFEDEKETDNLAVAIAPANFTEIRQVLEYLSKMLNAEIKVSEPKDKIPSHFIDGRCAEIILLEKNFENTKNSLMGGQGGNSIGFLGEIHPRILKNWKIKMPVALMEINLEEIFKKLE